MGPFVKIARLCACSLNISKSLYTFICNGFPVLGSDDILREELRAHAYAEHATLYPFREVLLVR